MSNLRLIENDYLPLREVVYLTLRDAILRGEIKPGERMLEMKLASVLGVSRTPIREAISRLEQDGLVIVIPRRGAQVACMTLKDMEDVYKVRTTLETLALSYVCGKMTTEQIAELRLVEKAFEQAVSSGEFEEIERKDQEFHMVIYRATDNKHLVSILGATTDQLSRYRWAYLQHQSLMQQLIDEHRAIVTAIESGDYDASLKATMNHLESQQAIVRDIIK